ncbi:MAG: bifunctional UDP-N-acetylmuramoyl-tripeptide:D-alanyl-D-alanine ligase/alanine racemase [Chlorobi bacterium]|nr:bifunctional UDP-N-acetylmuramoyl-tripeptide:D-alanyl-D-alanine ligase/alanine racemase [Chlorobiota bacterium]
MAVYCLKQIAEKTEGKLVGLPEVEIKNILLDSRSIYSFKNTLFFAITGKNHNGHQYIPELLNKGINCFVIEKNEFNNYKKIKNANFILVQNTLSAFQKFVAFHRKNFEIPIIGITGSNGKTMVKEWLFRALQEQFVITRSPKSYNSQIGVPLSVWQLNNKTELGIFEAGISEPGEMIKLNRIIQPTVGLITNIGPPHQENFESFEQKAREKLKLFENCKTLIYCTDQLIIHKLATEKNGLDIKNTFTWSRKKPADLRIQKIKKQADRTLISGEFARNNYEINLPYTDNASIENAIHVWCVMLYFKIHPNIIAQKLNTLPPVAMRMELLNGNDNCSLINDIYNSDFDSLKIAIDFLEQQNQYKKKSIILSDIFQSGMSSGELYAKIARLINSKNIHRFVGIGNKLTNFKSNFTGNISFYKNTTDFINEIEHLKFSNEAILLKGSRTFQFEQITEKLQEKTHSTRLEINLDSLIHNLNFFRAKLYPATKIMVMVKAFSYGSGSFEIANILQYHNVDYLGVAFVDEGISLRKNGITLPILVLNPEIKSFSQLVDYELEPEIFSFKALQNFQNIASKRKIRQYPIHIKLDTGMHRLGFMENEIDKLIQVIKSPDLKVKSIFSHLVASEEQIHDSFSQKQFALFKSMSDKIINSLNYKVDRHILNSSGIERFPEMQMEMVRLGIGLYGISPNNQALLQNISTFKTNISQIKTIPKNDTIGYNRKGKVTVNSKIGIIPIGYADGLSRLAGNGNWQVIVNNKRASTVGNICMDMCMINLTGVEANEGDEVIIFGNNNTIIELADKIKTIPYEILTGISQRVKRIYYKD